MNITPQQIAESEEIAAATPLPAGEDAEEFYTKVFRSRMAVTKAEARELARSRSTQAALLART